ncbi:MAG: ACP S-malonyltransferase [bacterium]|nr:ACP S-malonyltransferase [bacterium]
MAEKIAFIFPGQGSQTVGMGKDICAHHEAARFIFAEADEALGKSLSTMCFEGPEDDLGLTVNTQPAIVATSLALFKCFTEKGPQPSFVAGHSVGEYAALAAAGALSIQDVIGLVAKRGQLMDDACPAGTGGMAALIGMDREKTLKMLNEMELSADYALDLAGLNCPGQVVVAGHLEAIDFAINNVREFGGRMGVKLNVSGPFHSRLMKPAEDGLSGRLTEADFSEALIPVLPNTLAKSVSDPQELKKALMSQLTLPVLWEDSVRYMLSENINTFVEFGAGNVLAGMIRKIDRKARVIAVHDSQSLNTALEELV